MKKWDEIEVYNNWEMQRDFTYIEDIVEWVIKSIDNIKSSNNQQAIEILISQLKKLKDVENINTAIEGIVFEYEGNVTLAKLNKNEISYSRRSIYSDTAKSVRFFKRRKSTFCREFKNESWFIGTSK